MGVASLALAELREWQCQALLKFEQAAAAGYVEVATGAGKTHFSLAAYQSAREGRRLPLLVLVPTLSLADQWAAALEVELGLAVSSRLTDSEAKRADAIVTTYRGATRRREHIMRLAKTGAMIICDEVHSLGAPQALTIPTEAFRYRLGLSATPDRPYDPAFTTTLRRKIGECLYQYSVEQAVSDGVLVPFITTNVRVPFAHREYIEYQRLTRLIARAAKNSEEDQVKRLSMLRARVERRSALRPASAAALLKAERFRKAIVFFEDIDRASECVQLLERAGIRSVQYDTSLSENARRSAIADFRYGVVAVIVACRALDEGFDEPTADLAIIAASTRSRRQRIQRMGRVLRTAEGKERAAVINLYSSQREHLDLIAVDNTANWKEIRPQ